ncbi:MAG: magnesium chelatase subunit D [Gemmatimonadales bacterium]
MITRALTLLALDPVRLGGAVLRGPAGPVRDALLTRFDALLPPAMVRRRVPPGITTDRLLGGLDLTQTLALGRPVLEPGLLETARQGVLLLPMAERVQPFVSAALLAALDGDAGQSAVCLLALDESTPDEPGVASALRERLALDCLIPATVEPWPELDAEDLEAARARLPRVTVSLPAFEALSRAALALGVGSSRAEVLALRLAVAHAALERRQEVADADLIAAVELVLVPRATRLPAPPEPPPEEEEPAPPPPESGENEQSAPSDQPLADRVLSAVQASLPAELLAQLGGGKAGKGSGKGARVARVLTHGRRVGTRTGDPRRGRLDVVETLRAAAPWQRLRTRRGSALAVRRDDFRLQRLMHRTGTTVIFAVDASGSSALHRLNEAKGAVELLLAESYVRRDRVALISFRGRKAEIMLPPTRSLARARRTLAGLPGGGGTPVASALVAADQLAQQIAREREGGAALLVLLTDGRANVSLDGSGGRPKAEEDALTTAKAIRLSGLPALLLDTAPRPAPFARQLAEALGAQYLPLPVADAQRMSAAVQGMTRALQEVR